MTFYRDSVILRDFNMKKDMYNMKLPEGMEAAYKQIDNNETYFTLINNDKEMINNKLAELNIASDRVRTLNNLPKYRVINSKVHRIQ